MTKERGRKKGQKTSISFPRPLWEAAKIRAMREGRTLSNFVAEALAAHMAKPKKEGGSR